MSVEGEVWEMWDVRCGMWDLGIGEGGIDSCVTKGEEVPTCFEANWSTNGETRTCSPWPSMLLMVYHSKQAFPVRWRALLVRRAR